MNKLKNKKAFTLVELIVVITILAILATIGFVSFSGYLAGTRDTNRIAQLKSMSDALELYSTKKDLPIPDNKVDIKAGSEVIAYQGYIGKNVLETIEYTESGLDPKDKNYFSYYLTKNKKYFQLLAFLEEENQDKVAINNFSKTFARDYSERFPKTTGKKLGILTDEFNTPIQAISEITSSGYLDTSTGSVGYNIIFDNENNIFATGSEILGVLHIKSYKADKLIGIDENLKLYMSMNNIDNGKVLDESLNGNDGILSNSGTEIIQGGVKESVVFDNTNGEINIKNNNFVGIGEFTFSSWVRPDGDHKNYNGTIISSGDRNYDHWAFCLNQDNTKIVLRKPSANIPYSFNLGEWYLVTITRDNSGLITYYINGEKIGTDTVSFDNLISDDLNTKIGKDTYTSEHFTFNGGIDDVRIYDRVLSAGEIKALYWIR